MSFHSYIDFVHFAVMPEVLLLNRRQGQIRGRETILDCDVIASPHGFSIWRKNGEPISGDTRDYHIRVYEEKEDHKITLSLTILNVSPRDYGDYSCQASNKLGSDSETMVLYGMCGYSMYVCMLPVDHTILNMCTFNKSRPS